MKTMLTKLTIRARSGLAFALLSILLLSVARKIETFSFVQVKCREYPGKFRVAVLISGQPRTLIMNFDNPHFPKGLEQMNLDASFPSLDFIEKEAPVVASFHNFLYPSLKSFDVFFMISIPSEIDVETRKRQADVYCNALRPNDTKTRIVCKAESDIIIPYSPEIMKNFFYSGEKVYENGLLQQLYGLYYVNRMRKIHELKTGTRYSHMMRVRPDIIFAQKFPPLQSLDFGRINTPNILYASSACCCGNEDWFGIGAVDIMDRYFDRISTLFQTFDAHWRDDVWSAESFLISFLERHNAKLSMESRIVACVVKPTNRRASSAW